MNVSELKTKYSDKKFYKIRELPHSSMGSMEVMELFDIQEFFELSDHIGYYEETIDVNAIVRSIITNLLYTNDFNIRPEELLFARDYVYSKSINELGGFFANTDRCIFYSFDYPVKYTEELNTCGNSINGVIEEKIKDCIREYKIVAEKEEAELEENIAKCINSYKTIYNRATTIKEKELIIKRIQYDLKQKYGLDGRGDQRANKIYIRDQLENNNAE